MYEVQNPDVPEGTVVDVMQAGYVIGDRCLRPALVAIAKGGAKACAAGPGGEGPWASRPMTISRVTVAPRGGPSSQDTGGKA